MTVSGFSRLVAPRGLRTPALPRPSLAIPLSLLLHAAIFSLAGRLPWTSWTDRPAPPDVVWLSDWRPAPPPRAVNPAATEGEAFAEPAGQPTAAEGVPAAVPAAAPPSGARPRPAPAVPAPSGARPAAQAPRASVHARVPAGAAPGQRPGPNVEPGVDWEKERQRAAVQILERTQRNKAYRTFSVEDLPKNEAPPQEPSLVRVPTDNCRIVTGKLERFAARMLGRCVRDARSDLFAAIKPDYLRGHPVCEDAPGAPATFVDASGREFNTTKCRLVIDGEE